MKKSMGFSMLIHILVIILLVTLDDSPVIQEGQQPPSATTEVTLEETGSEAIQVKEVGTEGEEVENTNFYWGLGISTSYFANQLMITKVYSGYNGEAAGLQVGDLVMQINGKENNQYDIRGDGPSKLVLTILRKNVIITIYTERGKVYY